MKDHISKYLPLITLLFLLSCSDDSIENIEVITLDIYSESGDIKIIETKADATSIVTLKANIDPNADSSIQTITFNKSDGTFLEASNTATEGQIVNGEAFIKLQVVQEAKPLFFSATVTYNGISYEARNNIDLIPAYPDTIIIEPSKVNVNQGETVNLNIILQRVSGKVSIGTKATYEAIQIDSNTNNPVVVGRFTNTTQTSTTDEKISNVVFHTDTGDFIPSIPVTIAVSAKNDDGEVVGTSLNINLN